MKIRILTVLYSFLLLFIYSNLFSQNTVSLYNEIPKRLLRYKYILQKHKGKWIAKVKTRDNSIENMRVNVNNSADKIEFPQLSKGYMGVTIKVMSFKGANNTVLIAVIYDEVMGGSGITNQFTDFVMKINGKWYNVKTRVLPDLRISKFFKKQYNIYKFRFNSKIMKMFYREFILPNNRRGKIKVNLKMRYFPPAVRKPYLKYTLHDIQKSINKEIHLKWNKSKSRFSVVSKKRVSYQSPMAQLPARDSGIKKIYKNKTGHKGVVYGLAYYSKRLITAAADGKVKIWRLSAGPGLKLLKTINAHSDDVNSVILARSNKIFVTASDDSKVKIWKTTGRLLRTLKGHKGVVYFADISPDEKVIASCSSDKTVKLWNIKNGNLIKTLHSHNGKVTCVKFSPNGKYLISTSTDKTVKLWNAKTGSLVHTFRTHKSRVGFADFSRDSSYVVSVEWSGLIVVHDIKKLRPVQVIKGHKQNVYTCFFHPDSKRVCTAGRSGEVIMWWWKNKTGYTLAKTQNPVVCVLFVLDNDISKNYALVGAGDAKGNVIIMQVKK